MTLARTVYASRLNPWIYPLILPFSTPSVFDRNPQSFPLTFFSAFCFFYFYPSSLNLAASFFSHPAPMNGFPPFCWSVPRFYFSLSSAFSALQISNPFLYLLHKSTWADFNLSLCCCRSDFHFNSFVSPLFILVVLFSGTFFFDMASWFQQILWQSSLGWPT